MQLLCPLWQTTEEDVCLAEHRFQTLQSGTTTGGALPTLPLQYPIPHPQHIKQVLPELFDRFSLSLLETRQQRAPCLQQTLQWILQDA